MEARKSSDFFQSFRSFEKISMFNFFSISSLLHKMHLDKIFDFENNAIAEKNCKNSDFAVAWKSCKIAVKEAIENNPPKAAIDRVQNESIEEEFVFSAKNNAFRCYVKLTKLPILPISTVDFLDEIKFNSQTLTLTRTHSHTEVKTGEEINSTTKRNQKPAEST